MYLNSNILKNYKAKPDGTTIFEHNQDLLNILNQLNIEKETYNQMLKIIKYHDVGKIVDSFQNNIDKNYREVRHEMLSASVEDLTDAERFAILTHHKSLDNILPRFDTYKDKYKKELKEMEKNLNIKMVDISNEVLKYKRNDELLKNKDTILLKGLLLFCDHLGSSNIEKLDKGFNANEKFKFKNYSSIQKQAKLTSEDVIMISSTGSGKTEASLFWADNMNRNKDRRIFYILPRTASINAMYKRFKKENISVGMLHSKANYFLYKESQDIDMAKEQYQAYKYFTKNITVSTIYQIFKAVFNCKFNEMILAMLNNSIFIIDEIHCFDKKELAIILTTLKFLKDNFNINICIMSASIPQNLLNLIKKELNINKIIRQSDFELAKIKRHRITYKDKYIDEDIKLIKKNIKEGKKVLIVLNTVNQSQSMRRKIGKYVKKEDIALLHSGFNARDREKIESELKDKKVLIGTQTIEVSLDIDYDVMFTEISPIDSQIQRWGRINRKRIEQLIERKMIYVYKTQSQIYNKNIVEKTKEVLQKIDNLDERLISSYLDYVYDCEFESYYKYKEMMIEVVDDCKAGIWDSNAEYSSFAGISVLPFSLKDEYEKLIENKKYFEANSLLVNISDGKFAYAIRKGIISKEKDVFIIKCSYDDKYGLQIW